MALSMMLTEAGLTVDKIATKASVTLDKTDEGFTITAVHLDLTARIPNTDEKTFLEIANKAKAGCPVSRLLKAEITLDAKLES